MQAATDPLVLDLVEWIAESPRPYAEAIEAWRTSCSRLTVWEEAFERGFLAREAGAGRPLVAATPLGRRFLAENRRAAG